LHIKPPTYNSTLGNRYFYQKFIIRCHFIDHFTPNNYVQSALIYVS